ncbi:hypothetical protein IFM12275_24240 [Nocardia sputorum]|nr:hypothetical protein IFM12275_24240 [Nocardia sputorum]
MESLPDNTVLTRISGFLRWNSSITRIRAFSSSGLAPKKNVNAPSSSPHPAAKPVSDTAPATAAPRNSPRRLNIELPILSDLSPLEDARGSPVPSIEHFPPATASVSTWPDPARFAI